MNIQPRQNEPLVLSGRDVTAVLGPTNTGKTHLAIDRMVAHESGVIGLPLRLLAREVYQRICEKVGADKVALITGEEKIAPAGARYSVCTVEAMPRETDAAFVAIDEVQLAGDLERGHIFTDRILHLRGRQETLLLGAATMRGILERLLRGLSVLTRPRLSHLAYAGARKLTRLPRRSAIVAFSADEVYGIAELIRRQQGGAAVVLGALSPRTRNAQVALYQSGDVDYIVATDAIGMGLNLDIDHVAFAQNRKFDGYQYRQLTAAEMGQVAGRAGRHMRDGTFGVTGRVDPLGEDLVQKLEAHDFEPVRVMQWRTAQFDYSSIEALKHSIETNAPVEGLTRAPPAVDQQALEHMSKDDGVRALATGAERVRLLWEACAIPDYRKIAPAQHADIVASIYLDVVRRGHVDEDYMADQVRRADVTEGDIDALSQRIAQIRTWTFVSNRPGWLADPLHWQERTREIEDRLSDALHERLTKRFVDRRTSVLMRRLRENSMTEAEIDAQGTVTVEGHHVGELQGFRFTADQSAGGEDAKAVRAAAQKALAAEFETRAERFAAGPNGDIALGSDGALRWIGAPIGMLTDGEDALRPRVVLLADEQLTGPARDKVAARAERFVNFQIESLLKPLVDLRSAETLSGMARGIAFRLVENFGLIDRREIAEDVRALDQDGRAALRRLGVRFGAYHIFVPALLKPAPAGLITLLWALKNDGRDKPGFGDVVNGLATGRTSLVVDPAFDPTFYRLGGYRVLGRRAVRIDILERLADLIRPALAWRAGQGARPDGAFDGNAFIVTPPMMSILGATAEDMQEILKGLGYRGEPRAAEEVKAKLDALDLAAREAAEKAAAEKAAQENAATEAADADGAAAEATNVVPGQPGGEEATQENAAEAAGADAVEATSAEPEQAAGTEAVADVETAAAPPSVLPDISPSRGEIEPSAPVSPIASVAEDAPTSKPPISPLEGEMSGRTEGGDMEAAPAEAGSPDDVATQGTSPVAEPDEPPKPVMLWRPGRFERPRHQHGQRHGNRRFERPVATAAATGEQAEGAPSPDGKQRFDRRFKGKPGEFQGKSGRPDFKGKRPDGGQRGERPHGSKPDWKGKAEFKSQPRKERGPDPDSPFAKLAALRDQLRK